MAIFARRRGAPASIDESGDTRERTWYPWMPVAALLGLAALTLGVWALTRTGLDTDHIFSPQRRVIGFDHTPALGLGEAIFGVVMLLALLSPLWGRMFTATLGMAAVAFGVIVVIDAWTARVHAWTGANERYGWVLVAAGALAFLAATTMPTVRHRTVTHTREVTREVPVPEVTAPEVAASEERAVVDERRPRHWWQPSHGHSA